MIDEALLTLVSERAPGAAAARRLDDDVVGAVARTGVNRSLLPAPLGGSEAPPREVAAAIERLAMADGSTAWCTAISAGANLFAGYVPEPLAREVYDDPDRGGAGVFASLGVVTAGADGTTGTLTGRWPFASNCQHSRWIGLGAFVEDADGQRSPVPRLFVVRVSDLTVEPTWESAGLCATGSHHVRADGVAVELARSCSFADRPWAEAPLWRLPVFTVLGPLLAAAPLGVARGAVDSVQRRVRDGAAAMRGSLADDPVGLAALAGADSALRAAAALLWAVCDEAWAVAVAGDRPPRALQARTLLAAGHAMDTAYDAASTAHRLSGGAAAYAGHPALTALHDVAAARQHVMFGHQHRPALARIAAGWDEAAPPFVV